MAEERSIAELARRWSELLLADPPEYGKRLTAAAERTGSLLRPPAGEAEVAAAEDRLGCRLPPSYREFLLCSDGAYADDYGPTRTYDDGGGEEPPRESATVGVGFLPVQDLRWLRDVHPRSYEEYAPYGGAEPVSRDGEEPETAWWAALGDGLLVATDKAPGTTVLIPFPGLEEWQLWNIHKETSVGYLSFRSFLEFEVLLREPVTDLAEVAEIIRRGAEGDDPFVQRLARVVIPEAIPLLRQVAGDARLGLQSIVGLGRIGTPDAVEAILEQPPPRARFGLIALGTDRARDILAERADIPALLELGDPRAFTLAAAGLAAGAPTHQDGELLQLARTLSVSRDPAYAPVLRPYLDAEWVELRYQAAATLAMLGDPEGERVVAALIKQPGFPHGYAARALLDRLRRDREPPGS